MKRGEKAESGGAVVSESSLGALLFAGVNYPVTVRCGVSSNQARMEFRCVIRPLLLT